MTAHKDCALLSKSLILLLYNVAALDPNQGHFSPELK